MSERAEHPPAAPKGLISRLAGDRRGVFALLFAFMLPIIVGFIGLGVEVGLWFQNRRNAQSAADFAAIAAVYEVRSGNGASTITTRAETEAARNGIDTSSGDTVTVNYQYPTGTYTPNDYSADNYAVEVVVTKSVALLFSKVIANYFQSSGGLFTDAPVTVTATAVATLGSTATACILSLEDTSSGAMTVTGGNTATLTGCAVAVNSSDDAALKVTGGSTLATDCATTVGGYSVSGSGSTINSTQCSSVVTYGLAIADPYDSLTEPDEYDGSCSGGGSAVSVGSGDSPISPGTYCNGLTFSGTVELQSGVYIIYNGNFSVNAGATVTSASGGVTIFLTGSASNKVGTVSLNGNADLTLSAQSTGSYAGMLFWQDDLAPESGGNNATFNGGADMDLTGVIYFPSGNVNYTGGVGTPSSGSCMQIVAQTVDFSSNTEINITCASSLGMSTIEIYDKVNLVE